MNNCKNLEQNKCLPPKCKWVDKKRKYCRTTKNLTKNKKSNDIDNSNIVPVIGGCEGTRYGCCPDNITAKHDEIGSNCSRVTKKIKIKTKKKNQKKKNLEFINDIIIRELSVLRDKEFINRSFFKVKHYNVAIDAIKNDFEDTAITNGNILNSYKGIGKKIIDKINEIINTGKLGAAERAKEEFTGLDLIIKLSKIHGIGSVQAKKLVETHNIKSIDELINRQNEIQPNGRPLLNDVQQKGLKYFDDLIERIPRDEMDLHEEFIRNWTRNINQLYPGTQITMVGSYRRNKKDSGDIDLLITDSSNNPEVFHYLIREFKEIKYITETLSLGKKKFMGICNVGGEYPWVEKYRRLDILYTTKEEYPFALLYFTGSSSFNTALRDYANSIGYRLNEYNLKHYDISKKKVGDIVDHKFSNERDIFKFLKIPYIEPPDREPVNLKPYI